ncbi:MAG: hypothetical protein PVSMB8_07570 [Vulcanimicrobiaceae bacterium]
MPYSWAKYGIAEAGRGMAIAMLHATVIAARRAWGILPVEYVAMLASIRIT